MHAIRTNHSNFTYEGQGVGPDCADLPCTVDESAVVTVYEFTDEERAQIAKGGTLELAIFQRPIPPIALAISEESVVEQWLPGDLRCQNEECRSVWLDKRGLEACGHCGGPLVPAMLAT